MKSIWNNATSLPHFPSVEKDFSTSVLIIGGGICGILCAHMLKERGVDYILVEADEICKKTTANTTAKITSLHGLVYGKLTKEKAKLYYDANEDAIKEYERLCTKIDCDFERKDSFVFTLNNKRRIENEFFAIKEAGIDAEYTENLDIPFNALCGIKFKNQAQFNPIKFVAEVSVGLNIFEHSRVTEMVGTSAIVNGYKITADKVIVATHFPFINKHGSYFIKMFQHRSYAMAFKSNSKIDGMYVDDTKFGLSLRSYGDTIILGGEGHRTGKKSNAWAGLKAIADKYFPGNTVINKWATQDCMTLDGVPYIGSYSTATPDLYVATGFNKWGMTSSMVAAKLICDLICNKRNKYKELFSPSRSILKPQLAINTIEALHGWLSFTKKRCPHLGCALKWNKYEHTWDCSCHGSRFSESNKLLDGPANNDIKS